MKRRSLADVTEPTALTKILVVSAVLLIAVIALLAYTLWWGSSGNEQEKTVGLEIVDITIEEPAPSLLNDKFIAIDHGESVTLNITVKNIGENITSGEDYCLGLAVVTNEGSKYWRLPPDQYVGIDLGPQGTSRHTFVATNKHDYPFRGSFELQGYVTSVTTGEELSRSEVVTVEVRYPT